MLVCQKFDNLLDWFVEFEYLMFVNLDFVFYVKFLWEYFGFELLVIKICELIKVEDDFVGVVVLIDDLEMDVEMWELVEVECDELLEVVEVLM